VRVQNGLILGSFEPPERVMGEGFLLRKLMAKDAKADYEAVTSNIDLIRKIRGGSWPTIELTYEDDVIDLGWHQREFEMKRCFAYAVMDRYDKEMLGCVYFYPPGHPFNNGGIDHPGSDVIVNMWVTNKAYDTGLYSKVWKFVEGWVETKWPFKAPYFSNAVKP
jgi:hypothetical protein